MITLSIVGLVRILIWIISIYFFIKILSRLFAPFLLRFAAKKMEKRFGDQFGDFQKKQPKYKDGETIVDKIPKNSKPLNKDVGEYIDYEEID